MARYASETTVSVENSRTEIERILRRYKADGFYYGMDGRLAVIGFRLSDRQIRFRLTMPDPNSRDFTQHSRGRRTPEAAEKMWEQACRQAWRALALVIKAKLEAVAASITTVEDEFLAHTLLPSGETVGEWAKPQMEKAYRLGAMPSPFLALAGPQSKGQP